LYIHFDIQTIKKAKLPLPSKAANNAATLRPIKSQKRFSKIKIIGEKHDQKFCKYKLWNREYFSVPTKERKYQSN
jgi:hypothetical protein